MFSGNGPLEPHEPGLGSQFFRARPRKSNERSLFKELIPREEELIPSEDVIVRDPSSCSVNSRLLHRRRRCRFGLRILGQRPIPPSTSPALGDERPASRDFFPCSNSSPPDDDRDQGVQPVRPGRRRSVGRSPTGLLEFERSARDVRGARQPGLSERSRMRTGRRRQLGGRGRLPAAARRSRA